MQQIADKITYLKLIFTKRKAAVRCSHDCLVFTRRAAVRCACKVARLSQVQPRDNRATFITVLPFAAFKNSSSTIIECFYKSNSYLYLLS